MCAHLYKKVVDFKDARSLLFEINDNEKQMQLKKRWLLGIATTKSDRKYFKKLKILKDKFLPESLVRDDNIFHESVKAYVEGLFGVCHIEGEGIGSQSNHATVKEVLDCLDVFSLQTLDAMRRKLKKVKATIPQLRTGRKKWRKLKNLIITVKKSGMKMLSQLGEGDELPEPLAKAMVIADLSLKLENHKGIFSKKYDQLAPKVKSLQDDIMKAIWRVKNEVRIPVLRDLIPLLELEAEISNNKLRQALRELLTEFLFECNDMDKIPESLSNILSVINGASGDRPRQLSREEKIEEEVDGILNFSAQTKQFVLDLLPDNGFDEDFTDAYVEQLVESDIDDNDDCQVGETRCFTNSNCESMDQNYEVESLEKIVPLYCNSSSSMSDEESCNSSTVSTDERELGENFLHDAEPEPTENKMRRNQDVAIQDACDKTSVLTHKLIGRLLFEFATLEGLDLNGSQRLYLTGDRLAAKQKSSSSKKDARNSAIVRAVEEVVPSFSDSGAMERLKKLIG